MPFPRSRARWIAPLVALLALAGCSPEQVAAEPPTHTLRAAETSYAGYLVPQRTQKLAVAPADLAVRPGEPVTSGAPLVKGGDKARARLEAAQQAASAYRGRIGAATRALEQLRQGTVPKHDRDRSVPSAAVRAVEHDITAALVADQRAAAQRNRERERAKLTTAGPDVDAELAYLKEDEKFARSELVNQLQALFENLRSEAQAALTATNAELATLGTTAPWDGVVAVHDGEVRLNSAAASFVFLATEAQVDSLSGDQEFALVVKSSTVGKLRLASVNFDAEATANPQSPRYQMRFDVVTEAPFTPRERATASLVQTSGRLAIPDDFLGRDADGHFVLRDGQRTPVEVSRDASGQQVIVSGAVAAGDRIEQVG